MRSVAYKRPDAIVVSIPGQFRSNIANAIIDAALLLEREYVGRRAKGTFGRYAIERAKQMRSLALEIMP